MASPYRWDVLVTVVNTTGNCVLCIPMHTAVYKCICLQSGREETAKVRHQRIMSADRVEILQWACLANLLNFY